MLDILIFFIMYFLWIIAVIGIGKSTYKIFKFKNTTNYPSFEYGIIGIIIIVIIVGLINFFAAFSIKFSFLILLWGVFGFLLFSSIKNNSIKSIKKEIILGSVIFCFILAWFHPIHDTGGYHLSAIKWIISQKIPYGLANLYSRLGFNTTWFLGEACTEQLVFFFHRPLFIMNGVLLFLYGSTVLSIFTHSNQLDKKTGLLKKISDHFLHRTAGEIFIILSIFPVILISGYFISTASPDFPIFILIMMVFALSFQLSEEKPTGISKYHQILFLTLLVIFLVTLKASSITVVIFLIGLVLIYFCYNKTYLKENCQEVRSYVFSKITLFYLVLITLLIFIFILRGIILSGNPLFPIYIPFHLDLPWNVPKEITIETMNEVIAPARLYTSQDLSLLSNMNWIFPWLIVFVQKNITLFIIWMTTVVSLITYYLEGRPFHANITDKNSIQKKFTFFCLLLALLFWFISAPDPRFGYGYLYALPLFLIVYPIIGKNGQNPKWFAILMSKILCIYMIMIALLMIAMFFIWGINIPFMPDISYSIEKSENNELIYYSHSWDHVWDMLLPNTPEDVYSKIIVERQPDKNEYRMFSFHNS